MLSIQPSGVPIFSYELGQMHAAKFPLSFRVGIGTAEYTGETIGISPNQFIMVTRASLYVGSQIVVRISVPLDAPGGSFGDVEASGHVVCGSKLSDGMFGYRVKLHQSGQ